MRKYYQLMQTEERKAELHIYGDITSMPYFDTDVSAYNLSQELANLDADEITVYINSYGGEVAEGLAIYNSLKRHSAKIKTVCDGFACSIASVIFMAGEERIMNDASMLMIHNAWTFTQGNAEDLRKQAEDLDAITNASINAYLSCVNISEEELRELMDAESWLTPQQAVSMGFATSIGEAYASNEPSQNARKTIQEKILLHSTTVEEKEKEPLTLMEMLSGFCIN